MSKLVKTLKSLLLDLGCMRCGGDMRNGKCEDCGWYEGA